MNKSRPKRRIWLRAPFDLAGAAWFVLLVAVENRRALWRTLRSGAWWR